MALKHLVAGPEEYNSQSMEGMWKEKCKKNTTDVDQTITLSSLVWSCVLNPCQFWFSRTHSSPQLSQSDAKWQSEDPHMF